MGCGCGVGGTGETEFVWTHNSPLLGVLPMLVNYSFTHCQCKDELGALWVWSITHFILSSSVYTLQYLIHTPPQLQSTVRF